MLNRILNIISSIFAILLMLSYLTEFIPPHLYPKFSLFAFVYPILLIINIGFVVFWLLRKWRYIILPVIAILIGFSNLSTFYKFKGKHHGEEVLEGEIKIMTYNVCSFHYGTSYNESKEGRITEIFEYIKEESPDILGLQDYYTRTNVKNSIHHRLVNELGLKYYYSSSPNNKYINGNAIYSRYPIQKSGTLFPLKDNNHSYIFADIDFGDKTFRVFNFHLASYKLAEPEKEIFESIRKGEINKEESKNIIRKLIAANVKRSEEVGEILPILNDTQLPYVVLGDFNDTPYSYTYKKIAKNMKDAFVEKGRGLGSTYNGVFPAYRIDYILFTDKNFQAISFRKEDLDYSDHYPVSTVLELK